MEITDIFHCRTPDRFLKTYGCTAGEAYELNGFMHLSMPGSPAVRYKNQKLNARKRGIGWEFTFPEWCGVWQESGKWDLRGTGSGYCMARIGDVGPYAVWNVKIKTSSDNTKEWHCENRYSWSYFESELQKHTLENYLKKGL